MSPSYHGSSTRTTSRATSIAGFGHTYKPTVPIVTSSNAGGTATIELAYDLPLEQTKTVGVRPIQGTFNIAGARIIAPGDPSGSVLYYRMSKLGGGRMPRVGSNLVDERATRMIHDWIAGMPVQKPGTADGGSPRIAPEDQDALESLTHGRSLSPPATARRRSVGWHPRLAGP